jgi:hypothetical protein
MEMAKSTESLKKRHTSRGVANDRIATVCVETKSAIDPNSTSILVIENVSENTTIQDIKRKISVSQNVPVHHQKIFSASTATPADTHELSDDLSLDKAGVQLGWKNARFNVRGDVLHLQTELSIQEYYPGGKHWCNSWTVTNSSQREMRISGLLLLFAGFAAIYSLLLSYLTS